MNKQKIFSTYQVKQFVVLLCLIIPSLGFSQNSRCVIYFKDNTKVEGLGRLKSDGQVKFRKNEDSEKVFYESKLIDRVEIGDDESADYQYKKIDDYISQWLEIIIDGKVCLYRTATTYSNPSMGMSGMNGSMGMGFGGSSTIINYYTCHKDETKVFKIASYGGINKRFKKTGAEFFKDCPVIVEKIENETYKKQDLEEIVRFYNSSNCGNKEEEASKNEVKTN